MCGIAGCIQPGVAIEQWPVILQGMTDSLAHRGPDDAGCWFDAAAGVGLGHRRLSIVDLSPLGHQPMASASGRYQLIYNGEIYNFQTLRSTLENLGHSFRGHSDTEIILAAVEQWGIGESLQRFVGMFALALWDGASRTLYLTRDRLGEKPLYYGWQGQTFLFGSELKALRAHPDWQGVVNRNGLALYLRYNRVPTPYSIYKNIYKLPPGVLLTLPTANLTPGVVPDPTPYWSFKAVAEAGWREPWTGDDSAAIAHLDSLLRQVVAGQMVADVPLGAFLSGGVDSSTIVALMQAQSSRPVKTFTIGFHETDFNEAEYAAAVAQHLGTDHTELYVTPAEAMAVIPRLPRLYDEPFADSSQIPTFLVANLTRQHVTVSLSGDGGDELFGGYLRYRTGQELWAKIRRLPPAGRKALAWSLRHTPQAVFDQTLGWLGPILAQYGRPGAVGQKLHKVADVLAVDSPEMLYRRLVSHEKNPAELLVQGEESPTLFTSPASWLNTPHFLEQMMYLDTLTYLPDDILVKVDRASMGVSLEARVPLLDHRVVEFAWKVPLHMKVRQGQSKWLLRQVLYQYVLPELIERPKVGFGVPIGDWLRGPLRDWAEALLAENRLRQEGFFEPAPIRQKWAEHLAGQYNWHYYLWDVLMFQAWHEKWEG